MMSSSHRFRKLPQPRPLAEPERQILSVLLGRVERDAESYECQGQNAQVDETCEDCPTIILSVDRNKCPRVVDPLIPPGAAVSYPFDGDVRVLLFVRDGYELETFRTDGEAVRQWPKPDELTFPIVVAQAFAHALTALKSRPPRLRARAHRAYADYLAAKGKTTEAYAQAQAALALLDPGFR